jgi:hypothetical protein
MAPRNSATTPAFGSLIVTRTPFASTLGPWARGTVRAGLELIRSRAAPPQAESLDHLSADRDAPAPTADDHAKTVNAWERAA